MPVIYLNVPHAERGAHCDVILKKTDEPVRPGKDKVSGAVVKDKVWIAHASDLILSKNTNLDNGDIVTWTGLYSRIKPKATIGVLPLFLD